jgi:5'-nucleotidase
MTDEAPRKIVYIDMDNVLVDFPSAFPRVEPKVLKEYRDKDEIPGIFALMDPMPGAIDAVRELWPLFDVYVLSTAPWNNPSAWQDKIEWIKRHFGARTKGDVLYKRLILSHHKNLNRGDFLIDDRPDHNGVALFEGEVIHFGPGGTHQDWPAVVAYLKERA